MTNRSQQNWPTSEVVDLTYIDSARDLAISILSEQQLFTGNLQADVDSIKLLADDIAAVADELSTDSYEAFTVLRSRIGGWINLDGYMRCLRA